MLIQHIRFADREGLWQIRCQDGVITAIEPHDEHAVAGRVLDGEGIGHRALYRAPYSPRYHPDGGRAELEPLRHPVRGDRALGRAQGAADPRRCEAARHPDAEMADRQRHPVRPHPCRCLRPQSDCPEGDAGSAGRDEGVGRAADRRLPAGGSSPIPTARHYWRRRSSWGPT